MGINYLYSDVQSLPLFPKAFSSPRIEAVTIRQQLPFLSSLSPRSLLIYFQSLRIGLFEYFI